VAFSTRWRGGDGGAAMILKVVGQDGQVATFNPQDNGNGDSEKTSRPKLSWQAKLADLF